MGIIDNTVWIRNAINWFIWATYLIIKKNAKLTFEVFSFWDVVFFLCVLQTGIFLTAPSLMCLVSSYDFGQMLMQVWVESVQCKYGGADWWVSQSFVRLRSYVWTYKRNSKNCVFYIDSSTYSEYTIWWNNFRRSICI